MVNVVPSPGLLFTVYSAIMHLHYFFYIAQPKPKPLHIVKVAIALHEKNLSNIIFTELSCMPITIILYRDNNIAAPR